MKKSITSELQALQYKGFIYDTKNKKIISKHNDTIDYKLLLKTKLDHTTIVSDFIINKFTFTPLNWEVYILKDIEDLKKDIYNSVQFFILFTLIVLFINSALFITLIYNSMFKDINSILSYFKHTIVDKNFKLITTTMHSKETEILKEGINTAMNEVIKYEKELKKSNTSLERSLEELHLIKTEQDKLLSLFDVGDSTLFQWNNDKNWSIKYISKSISKILGYSQEDIVSNNSSYKNTIYNNDLTQVKEEMYDAIKKDKYYINNEPYRMITKTGDLKWVISQSIIIRDSKNDVISFIGHIIDIDDLKRQEELLIQKSKMASLGEMISNIAHQWRQPLSIIATAATGTSMQKQLGKLKDKELLKNLELINDNAQYLSETINTFRNYLKEKKVYKEVILQERIKVALNIVEASLQHKYIELSHNLDSLEPIKIHLVVGELSEVIINIINNAKDALLQSKPKKPKIDIKLEKKKDIVSISIKDNGGGIPSEVLPKIFEPYFTTKHQSIGTGLGLHMSYKIITQSLKGKIYAKSTKRGAQFIIELPLK